MNSRLFNRAITVIAVPGLAMMGLLLLLLLLGQSAAGATPDGGDAITEIRSSASFTVSGVVTCEATGLISDVEVYAWNRDQGSGFVGDVTDANGDYSVMLQEGDYDLIFNPPCGSGCASQSLKGITGPSDLTLDVVLLAGHSVSGTVFDVSGTIPISDVEIYAFNYDTADGFGLPLTDANGHYCIGLPEGHYDLGFTPPPCLGLGPTGKDVIVTQSITLNVLLTSGFTVAGCVTDEIGDPVPGVQIYAYDPQIRGFGFSPTDESGCYSGTLPIGTFDIQFIPPGGRGLGSVTVFDVVSETVNCPNTPLPITLPAGVTISGRVTCQGEPVRNTFVYADPVGGAPGWGVYTVDDGSYELSVVPGIYDVDFVPPPETGFDTTVINKVQVFTDTVLDVDFCAPVKSVDELFAVPGERRTYQVVLTPTQGVATAWLTDVLPSAVSWAGDLWATSGNASYSDGAVTWSGPLTTGAPVTITFGVTVTHAPCCDTAAHTDIYTDVYNNAVLDYGQGNILYSTPAALAIGNPFGTGSERTFDVAFGDADNDGYLDLALGNHAPNQVCWNNGDGTFDCDEAFGGSATFSVDWGDMDGDGYLDLVVANSMGHPNLVCLNNGDRTFTCAGFSTCLGGGSCDAALGDVDGDGDLDIALGMQFAQDLIYYNDGDGLTFTTDTICYDGWVMDLAFGDVDNDDDLDLAVVGIGPDFVCFNDGTGHFNAEISWLAYRIDPGTWGVALGDADGDGDLDVAAGEATNYFAELYLNNGHGYFTETLFIGPAWDSTGGLAWGDVDCDGDLDLATGNRYQQTVVYFNDPVTASDSIAFSRKVDLGTDLFNINSVALGDVDDDGDLDLAVGSDGGQNIVYLNTLQGADVEIVKSSQPLTLAAGDWLTYSLVYRNNALCGQATNVIITDTLSPWLTSVSTQTWSSYTSSVPTASDHYTWSIGTMPSGGWGIITITAQISESASGFFTITNQATVAATRVGCVDGNLGYNTSIAHNIVDAEPPITPTLISPADDTITNVNTITFTWQASPSPDAAGYLLQRNGAISDVGNITHTTRILSDGVYTWTVAAYDALRNTSDYTDVWSFTVDTVSPTITATAPISGAENVISNAPVIITFSEYINANTFTYTIKPDLVSSVDAWRDDGTEVTLKHTPFACSTTFTVIVTAADDLAGNSLSDAPYAWHFTTAPLCNKVYMPIVLKQQSVP